MDAINIFCNCLYFSDSDENEDLFFFAPYGHHRPGCVPHTYHLLLSQSNSKIKNEINAYTPTMQHFSISSAKKGTHQTMGLVMIHKKEKKNSVPRQINGIMIR